MMLSQKIEDLLEKKADHFEVAKVIRQYIKDYFSSIENILLNNNGKDFLVRHTKKIDEFIQVIYRYVLRHSFKNYMPFHNSIPITLTALGSYGREELCLYSDIDLMIVYKNIEGFNTKYIIESILQTMWDSGLKIGHRVHEIEDLFKASKEDITIKTAMLEARFICGSKILWIETQRELNAIRHYNQKEFVLAKYEEYLKRSIQKPLNMEPNIKEGAGGLRDINTLYWIVNTLYNATKIKDLTPYKISDKDYKELRIALEFLYKVRLTLHLISKKKQDVLVMELLPEVAKKLKFQDTKFKTASLQLSEKVFESLWSIKTICNILIKQMIQPFLFKKENIAKLRRKRIKKDFYICENSLFTSFHYPQKRLTHILKELLTLPDEDYKYDISVVNALKHAKIEPKNENKTALIVKDFFYKEHIYQFIYAVYQAGILHKVIPPMKKVIHLPQFDGYHTYPVDIHSIKVLKHLENIEDPFIKELYESLSKDEKMVLKLATFLHDSGKGRKKEHSIVGKELFKVYAKKMGLEEYLIKVGEVLIENHTLMSHTAHREDIYNEKTILRFVSKIQTPQNLKMLYILTYADLNGVSKNIYSSFTQKLLKELYEIAQKSFFKKELLSETQRRMRKENSLKRNKKFKNLPKILQKKILQIPSNLFFIKHKTNEILEISKWAFELSNLDKEYLCKIEYHTNLTISIIRKTELNVGYLLGKLSYLNLVNMDIFKLFDNIKYFKIEFLENISKDEIGYIEQLIDDSFNMSRKVKYNKPCILKDEIFINCEHSESYAQMKLNTKDQKGLMAYLISVFDDIGIDIASAKIQTIKKRAINLFLLEKNGNFCKNLNKIYDIIC